MTERKRSFYGWGYEDYQLPADELAWFERAWSGLFKVDRFEPAAMPRADEITLRAPRVAAPASLAAVCTTDKHERLLHSFGRSVHDLARMIHRRDFSNPPDVVAYPKDGAGHRRPARLVRCERCRRDPVRRRLERGRRREPARL